ncbi:MAG: ABC transporter ATP-binding protein [Lachnospiraceae bacterium]|jgi:ABC-type multidrug transport system, ATPase component|nr:ABC transporter ATP-binding protein [Lachnospiraceae bacterium]
MGNILECHNLTKKYGSKVALDNISLSINSGKITGLLGPNGSGKTTLIKIASGILSASEGEVMAGGNRIGVESKKIVSYLPERPYFSPGMKVSETIKFFKDFYSDFSEDAAAEMLKSLEIKMDARIRTLSKGNREKVQLVLVMSRKAKLYLLDEPMGGVDPAARDFILKTILMNYNEEAGVIISTHLISDVEKVLDDVIFIRNGKMILHESVDQIRSEKGKSVDALFREVFAC